MRKAIQFDTSGEAMRLERSARYSRAEQIDIGHTQPQIIERSRGPSSEIPALGPASISAVVVKVRPGVDPNQVQSLIARWPDVTVHSFEGQRELLLGGIVDRSRRQLGLFRILLIIVSAIIMALILYTLTLDKLHDIAMLKLMGARNGVDPRADLAAGDSAGHSRLRSRLHDRPVGLSALSSTGDPGL